MCTWHISSALEKNKGLIVLIYSHPGVENNGRSIVEFLWSVGISSHNSRTFTYFFFSEPSFGYFSSWLHKKATARTFESYTKIKLLDPKWYSIIWSRWGPRSIYLYTDETNGTYAFWLVTDFIHWDSFFLNLGLNKKKYYLLVSRSRIFWSFTSFF
jgi:hypothetical protein